MLYESENTAESSLDRVEASFLTLTESPGGLGVNGADFPGLADRWFGLRELRVEVTRPQTSVATRQAVWAFLLRSREVDAWKVAAVGMAMPALRHIAATLAPAYRGDVADLDAEVLTGFVEVFAGLPADAGGIPARLVFGGYRAGLAETESYRRPGTDLPVVEAVPPWPWLDARWLLAQATEREVISSEDARLLVVNRLRGVALAELSSRRFPGEELAVRRRRAERGLAAAVAVGDLGPGTGGGR
ncbi:hypothetical protein MXD63_26630 [Frankia sp. Cpl3]|uniref:hypothetical protein n=1 Tax=Parafrankia colletiae TaxID=573497 RepID=UPI001F515DDE|nr:hypothetical protein [Parafrankia colletiae]MCK9903615.1 hypothetical protein [Frankia sp. Cpl3]